MARPENDRGWSPSSPNSSQLIYWEAYISSLSGLGTASCVGLGSTFANSRNDGIRSSARVKSPVPSLPLPDLLLLPSVVTKKMGPIKTEREASSQRYLESTSTQWVCPYQDVAMKVGSWSPQVGALLQKWLWANEEASWQPLSPEPEESDAAGLWTPRLNWAPPAHPPLMHHLAVMIQYQKFVLESLRLTSLWSLTM